MSQPEQLKQFLNSYTKLVIIGVGNALRGDDGVGPYLIEQLKKQLPRREDVILINAQTVLENFIGKVIAAQPSHILIIDAVLDSSKQPGEWMLLELEQMESGFHSTHSVPLSLICSMIQREIDCSIIGIGVTPKQTDQAQILSSEANQACFDISELINSVLS